MCLNTMMISSRMPLLDLVLWLALQPSYGLHMDRELHLTCIFVVRGVVEDWESELALKGCTEGVVLDLVFLWNATHCH